MDSKMMESIIESFRWAISHIKELEASNEKLEEAVRLLRRGFREEADKVLEE